MPNTFSQGSLNPILFKTTFLISSLIVCLYHSFITNLNYALFPICKHRMKMQQIGIVLKFRLIGLFQFSAYLKNILSPFFFDLKEAKTMKFHQKILYDIESH